EGRPLPWLLKWIARRAPESTEQFPPIRQRDHARVGHVPAVLRAIAIHGHPIAFLQLHTRPAPVKEAVGTAHFEPPTGDLAAVVFFIDREPHVRISPLERRHRPRDL